MGQTHRRIGLVNVLTASARGAEGVYAHIGGIDVDLHRVIDLGVDEHAGKARVAPARRVKGRLAHQAVHTGLGAQQAVGVFAFDLDGGALDAGDVAGGFVFDVGLEALALGVLQVLAKQHAGPVAGLGTAGAGLDVQKGVHRVGRPVEHPPELEVFDGGGQAGGVFFERLQAGLVAVLFGHLIELEVVGQFAIERLQRQHDAIELLFFLAQFLGALGVVPDRRVFQRCVDGSQSFRFGIVVKDTPEGPRCGPGGLPAWCRSG
jgi:hypothetical protein